MDALVRLSGLTITPQLPVRIDRWTDQLEKFARYKLAENGTLAAAQFVMARAQGFESWLKFGKHIEAEARANSPVSDFEHAADAIVAGGIATLEKLLRDHPDLIRATSTRRHQATLLHYVAANGVEGYRQKTPKNLVQIAELLLERRPRRECHGRRLRRKHDARPGGDQRPSRARRSSDRAAATSARSRRNHRHCESPAGPLINICLANGRAQAAEFLASRGASWTWKAQPDWAAST